MTDPNFPPPGDVPTQRPFGEDGPSVVKPVAIALVVYNVLSVLNSLATVIGLGFMAQWLAEQAKSQPEIKPAADIYGSPWLLYSFGAGVPISIFALVCSICMMRRKAYGLAVTGAILAMVNPGGCCCLIGVGLGIWALIVLMKDEAQVEFSRS